MIREGQLGSSYFGSSGPLQLCLVDDVQIRLVAGATYWTTSRSQSSSPVCRFKSAAR